MAEVQIVEKINMIWGMFQKLVGDSFTYFNLTIATSRKTWNNMQLTNVNLIYDIINETSGLDRQVDFILGYWTCLLEFIVQTSDWTQLNDYIIAKLDYMIAILPILKPPSPLTPPPSSIPPPAASSSRKWWFQGQQNLS